MEKENKTLGTTRGENTDTLYINKIKLGIGCLTVVLGRKLLECGKVGRLCLQPKLTHLFTFMSVHACRAGKYILFINNGMFTK